MSDNSSLPSGFENEDGSVDKRMAGRCGLVALVVVGIGVAAIVGVPLLDSSGEGEDRNERVNVVTLVGTVDDGTVTDIRLGVTPEAGADPIDLSDVSAHYATEESSTTFAHGDGFEVEVVTGMNGTVMTDATDRAKIIIDLDDDAALESGEEVEVVLETDSGNREMVTVHVPDLLGGEEDGTRVPL